MEEERRGEAELHNRMEAAKRRRISEQEQVVALLTFRFYLRKLWDMRLEWASMRALNINLKEQFDKIGCTKVFKHRLKDDYPVRTMLLEEKLPQNRANWLIGLKDFIFCLGPRILSPGPTLTVTPNCSVTAYSALTNICFES